ncbi:hypothetical protein FOA52_014819 [Chlamydomonas sp. UWO 241]|nr:hypothetical protein FOA52_014819 [Chlamydomonas sp. UWO 241]
MCEAVDAQAGCVEGQAESPVLSLAAFGRLHSVHTLTLRSMACLRRMLLVEPPGAVFPRLQSLRLRLGGAAIASPADYEAIASAAPQGCTPW